MGIRHLLRQTVSLANPNGTQDRQGNRAFATAATLKARFQRTNKTIITPEREREPIHGIVFVDSDAVVEIGAKVTYDNTVYRVITIEDVIGRNGRTSHLELMCQLWSFGV